MAYALVFPGQGSQKVGMGKEFYDNFAASRNVFEQADDALGYSLSDIVFNGPDDELVKTAITQPAILTVCIAIMRAIEDEFGILFKPHFCAGHSLGEYTALVASGVLTLGDAVRLVNKRGALMQEAVPLGRGAMSAVLGLDLETVREICSEAAQGEVCSPANSNAPSQIVISGDKDAVERAEVIAKERGATKLIPLKVSAPFHCELMRPVADSLKAEFESIVWGKPKFPIIANVNAVMLDDVGAIQEALYAQTFSPVLWTEGVLAMEKAGVDTFVELGPGNVLTGLIKRICKGKKTLSVSKAEDIDSLKDIIGGDSSL